MTLLIARAENPTDAELEFEGDFYVMSGNNLCQIAMSLPKICKENSRVPMADRG